MARAGVVDHPKELAHSGYLEIQGLRRRNRILALHVLADVAGVGRQELAESPGGGLRRHSTQKEGGETRLGLGVWRSAVRRLWLRPEIFSVHAVKAGGSMRKTKPSCFGKSKTLMGRITPSKIVPCVQIIGIPGVKSSKY